MSAQFSITVDTDLTPERALALALPGASARPPGDSRGVWAAVLPDKGFMASSYRYAATDIQLAWPDAPGGIVHEGPGSPREWTPDDALVLSFDMRKDGPDTAGDDVLAAVALVWKATIGDATFDLDGLLLLSRFGGVTRRHNADDFWDTLPSATAFDVT